MHTIYGDLDYVQGYLEMELNDEDCGSITEINY